MLCRASVQPSPVRKVPKRKSPGPPCPGLTVTRSPIFVARISPVTTVVQRGRTKAVGDKNILLHKCHRAGVEPKLVMGFPPRHRFPPNGTPKPRCPPVAGASLIEVPWSGETLMPMEPGECRQPAPECVRPAQMATTPEARKIWSTSLERGSCLRLTLRQMRVARRQQRDQCAQILLESRAVTSVTSRSIVSFGP